MIAFKKYVLASVTALAFSALFPVAFAALYASSMNMIQGFAQKGEEKVEIGVVDALVHLLREMPHLWFLAVIPGVIGFRVGLRLGVGAPAKESVSSKRRRSR